MLQCRESFVDLGLNSVIINILKKIGYEKPLPIQSQCIPFLLKGYDVLGMAHTGSGKTAAFVLPLLQNIKIESDFVQGLIITPTRELAIQIGQVLKNFTKYIKKINIAILYGGQNYSAQFHSLKKGPHVLIGTPGRLLDHLNRGTADISQLKTLIIDEADEMLRMGFIKDMEDIIKRAPLKRQTALFSATLPRDIRRISKSFMCDPKSVYINSYDNNICADIQQNYWVVNNGINKCDALIRFLETENFDAAIVFVRTKSSTLQLSKILGSFDFNSAALNGDMNQIIREQTISRLRNGQLNILVTTDVAARGLDIHRINLVINYDAPNNYDSYVHRIGRTGRAGQTGKSLLFIERREYYLLRQIKLHVRSNISEVHYPTSNSVVNCRLTKFINKVNFQLKHEDIEIYRSLLMRIKKDQDLNIEYLAAVLLKIAQGNRPLVLPPDSIKIREVRRNKVNGSTQYHQKNNIFRAAHNNIISYTEKFRSNASHVNVVVSLYRIAIGLNDGVKIQHISKAILNYINRCYYGINNIKLFPKYSIVKIFEKKTINYKAITELSNIYILNKSVKIEFLGYVSNINIHTKNLLNF